MRIKGRVRIQLCSSGFRIRYVLGSQIQIYLGFLVTGSVYKVIQANEEVENEMDVKEAMEE